MTALLDADQLGIHLDRFTATLFRMETLPEYAVDSDGDDFTRWLAGESEPTWSRLNPWLDVLRGERDAGKVSSRVRVLSERLTDYERYACEWGYAYNVPAGEDIRILRHGEHDVPSRLTDRDWWLIDTREVVVMHYDDAGRFIGGEAISIGVGVYRDAQRATWASAEPFGQWWARHPELQRQVSA